MKSLYVFICLFYTLQISSAQSFEYALTQPEFIGSEINDILVVQDKVYLAGGLGWCHQPAIWLFDTNGQFIQYRLLDIEYKFGSVESLKYNDSTGVFTALLELSQDLLFRHNTTKVVRFDADLNILRSVDFSSLNDGLSLQSALLTDTSLIILADDLLHFFDKDLEESGSWEVPNTVNGISKLVTDGSHLLMYNDTSRDVLFSLDFETRVIDSVHVAPFTSLVLFRNYLFISSNQVIRKYDLVALEQVDSLYFNNTDDIELLVIHAGILEVIQHRPNQESFLQYYSEDLRPVLEIYLFPQYERNFKGDFSKDRILYQASALRKHETGKHLQVNRNRNMIPVVRKQELLSSVKMERPALDIVEVKILNEIKPAFCNTDLYGQEYCYFNSEEFLRYELTIKNTGNLTIDNIGYYTSGIGDVICYEDLGYHYRDQLDLEPGEEITITDSFRMISIPNYPKLEFYVTAPNHILTEEIVNVYTIEDFSTGIKEHKSLTSILLYPNPGSDYIQIDREFQTVNPSAEIINSSGQVIRKILGEQNRIGISELPSGFYSIRLLDDRYTFLGSFVKVE